MREHIRTYEDDLFASGTTRKGRVSEEKPAAGVRLVKSRFGRISIDEEKAICFPNGLTGFSDFHRFALATLPRKYAQIYKGFYILQSLDDAELSFMVFPIALENKLIAKKDLLSGAYHLQMKENHLVTLLIATITPEETCHRVTVNTLAPVLIDAKSRIAAQYILMGEHYDTRTPLAELRRRKELPGN